MGKKRGKKNRKQKRYNKKQFIDIFCTNCDLCLYDPVNPFFCYEEAYIVNPKGFSTGCYKKLIAAKNWLREKGHTGINIDISRFETIFCSSMCEEEGCELVSDCYETFKNQIRGNSPEKKKRRKIKKKKSRVRHVFKSYPTVFTNDNEDWRNRIEEILSDGNSDRQQDKVEESSSRAE